MLTIAVPKLPAIDLQATKRHYIDVFGFELSSEYPNYLIMVKDEIELHFFPYPDLKPEKSDFMIYVRMDKDIDELCQALTKKGVQFASLGKIETKPWDQREFSVLDINGTLITFGQSI